MAQYEHYISHISKGVHSHFIFVCVMKEEEDQWKEKCGKI